MAIAIRGRPALTRRHLLVRASASLALAGLSGLARPYLSRAADRPLIVSGVQSGDVGDGSAVVWARADRAARMRVETSTTESFSTILATASADALADRDFTAKVLLENLPPGQDIFYRVRFEAAAESGTCGETQVGHFRSPSRDRASVSFVWSGDTAGQGWGIDAARGGMRTYRTMLDNRPDFFIHSGDHIYADCTIPAELPLPNGEIWRNLVTEEKSAVAHSLTQFRGNYKYNLLDENFRAFHAEVPMFAQWDDHEVTNDWSPIGSVDETGYDETGTSRLVARGRRAFFEYMPIREIPEREGRIYRRIGYGPLLDVFMIDMRSYRDSTWNKRDDQSDTFILGAAAGLVEAGARRFKGGVEGDRGGPADRPDQYRRDCAWRRPAGAARTRDCRSAVLHEARRRQEYGLADSRHALYRRASLRSGQGRVHRFRAVLGVRLRASARRHLGPGPARQHLRTEGDVRKRLQRRTGRKSRAMLRVAVFRPRRHRRTLGGDDGDIEGCR
jgi:PhoD-like phosphatase/PhoD-like phosphatase, N-terminal domain